MAWGVYLIEVVVVLGSDSIFSMILGSAGGDSVHYFLGLVGFSFIVVLLVKFI